MPPMIRARNMTKVFKTPCNSASVDHIPVGHVRDFVSQYRFGLRARHAAQQSAAHRPKAGVAARTGGKRVHLLGVEYAHLGHADVGLIGEPFDRASSHLPHRIAA